MQVTRSALALDGLMTPVAMLFELLSEADALRIGLSAGQQAQSWRQSYLDTLKAAGCNARQQGFKSALSGFPKIVDFSERSKDDGKSSGKAANLNVPSGFQVDPKAAALHSKALSYIEQHPGTEYVAAVAAVERVTA